MAKVINRGLAKPDDPIFSGGSSVFSPHKFKQSTKTSQPDTDGQTPDVDELMAKAKELHPDDPEMQHQQTLADAIAAHHKRRFGTEDPDLFE